MKSVSTSDETETEAETETYRVLSLIEGLQRAGRSESEIADVLEDAGAGGPERSPSPPGAE